MTDYLSFRLPDHFLEEYKTKPVQWGFEIGGGNSLSELTFIAKYSRKKEDGTKEQWWECCRRCIDGMYSILKDWCKQNRTPWNEFKAQKSAQEAYAMMFDFKWTPPGRGLANMGTEMVHREQNNASLNNPLHVDTKVLTRDGWRRLGDLEGQVVEVLTSTFLYGRDKSGENNNVSKWVKAEISHIEEQPCIEITYNDTMGQEKTIVASENHRWFTRRASHNEWKRVSGSELQEGDFLPIVKPRKCFIPSRSGMQHGFFFGDGTRSNGELRQFGESTAVLANLFGNEVNYSNRGAWVGQCPLAWASIPEGKYLEDQRYVYGFLAGYFAADGCVAKNGAMSISSARLMELNDIRGLLLDLGIDCSEPRLSSTSSNFSEERELWTVRINRFDVTEDFFIKSSHRERWLASTYGKPNTKNHARIKSIKKVGVKKVLCATVPEYEQFVTESFILTSNCAAISTEKLSAHSAYAATMPFTRLMEMSMHGVGVGFDTRGAGKLTIHEPNPNETQTFVVPDTREGWAESVGALLESYFFKNRETVEMDYSLVRPAGSPLKRFGGHASGPEPLKKLHDGIRKIFVGRDGDKITSRDIVDIMNMIGKAVVAGGARRSALIALGESTDEDYVNLKNWELPENAERTGPDGWAWTSNNSVFAGSDDDLGHLVDKIAINGEPGVIYLDVMQQYGRLADPKNNRDYRANLVNPCVTADTWVLTANGARQVFELVGSPSTQVFNGKEYKASGFWLTGTKDVFAVTFSDGRELRLTDNHRLLTEDDGWVEVKDLSIGDKIRLNNHRGYSWSGFGSFEDGYILGHLIGDGTFSPDGQPYLAVWDKDPGSDVIADYLYQITDQMGHRSDWSGWFITANQKRLGTSSLRDFASKFGVVRGNKTITPEMERSSSDMTSGILSGLFDTDGSVQGTQTKGVSVRLSNTDRELLASAQRMLLRLGINSTIYFRREERNALLPDGRGGYAEYACKPCWELVISKDNLAIFNDRVGFKNPVKMQKLSDSLSSYKRELNRDSFVAEIVSIEFNGVEDVYDVTVDDVHAFDANGLVAHNCAEISLESHEFCCLVELYPANHTSFAEFERSIKHAYMYAKAVTLMPSVWPETNEVITRNRRIGVSMTGIVEFLETRSWGEMKKWMDVGYEKLRALDKSYSEWLGVRESIKVSTVKPAGTTSIIAGTTSGVHWPTTSGYYIRRQRFLKHDPIVEAIIEAGYHVEPDVMDPEQTVVASFPTKGLAVRSEREVSIWEKAHLAAMAQRYWADNMVSVTVSFDADDEKKEIDPLLRSLQGQLKSVSFLPITDSGTTYAQAPFEPIAEEEAVAQQNQALRFDMKKLYGQGLEAQGEKFCNSDVCTVDFG